LWRRGANRGGRPHTLYKEGGRHGADGEGKGGNLEANLEGGLFNVQGSIEEEKGGTKKGHRPRPAKGLTQL